MNKKFFDLIFEKTKNDSLSWTSIKRTKWDHLIFQKNIVYKAFEAKMSDDESEVIIVFLEKKYEDPEWDYAFEKHILELLVIKDNSLLLEISEDNVPKTNLLALGNLIENSNKTITDLFNKLKDK